MQTARQRSPKRTRSSLVTAIAGIAMTIIDGSNAQMGGWPQLPYQSWMIHNGRTYMTDSSSNIWYMEEDRKTWIQIPGQAKAIHVYNSNSLAAISMDNDLLVRRMPSVGGNQDWVAQGVAPISVLGTFPFGEDVWYAASADQRMYKWNMKPKDSSVDNVITSVLDIWIRDRIYINRLNIICSRGRDIQDWVCTNTQGDVHVLYVAASSTMFYYMDINYRLYYLPLPVQYGSQDRFVYTGYTPMYARGIGVSLDDSNPVPYVILSDGKVDEMFCFDSSKYNCGPGVSIRRLNQIPYDRTTQPNPNNKTPDSIPSTSEGDPLVPNPSRSTNSNSTLPSQPAQGSISSQSSSSLSISEAATQNPSTFSPITTQSVVRGSNGIATTVLVTITPTDPNLSQNTNINSNSTPAPATSTNNILMGVGIAGGICLLVAIAVALFIFGRLRKKSTWVTIEASTPAVRKKFTLFKQPHQRSFYKISRGNEMYESPLRTSSVGVVPQIITALPPLPRPADFTGSPITALSRDESYGSMTPLQRAYRPEESTLVRNHSTDTSETIVHPDSSMFDTHHALTVLSEMKEASPSRSPTPSMQIVAKEKETYGGSLATDATMHPKPIFVHEDLHHDDLLEVPPMYRPTPMILRVLAEGRADEAIAPSSSEVQVIIETSETDGVEEHANNGQMDGNNP
ncbi:hypothetical protein HDU97_004510 [Phlyctochytrium planicorne]|nr:hypothetical protein HDU97_004510 [Phlyctochytrium planicorne]